MCPLIVVSGVRSSWATFPIKSRRMALVTALRKLERMY
jgi:hypothetical protein